MKSIQIFTVFFFFFFFASISNAQFHQSVFPNFSGQQLLDKTVTEYKTTRVLGYGPARDTMYATIYNEGDSVRGIYTDHAVFLPPNVDPSVAIFLGGSDNGINAEHVFPQSKGARDGNPRSDMHHIFPSNTPVNSDRGSLEFKEISDNSTTAWYYKRRKRSGIPSTEIDLYSEGTSNGFEPAEGKKGNIARAMFYFYTMYKAQADAADSNFFENQRETLCAWHYLDPVDSLEWARTFMIAKHQNDNPNPFILDCSLASRSYCAGISAMCEGISSISNFETAPKTALKIYPNPTSEQVFLNFTLRENSDVNIRFYNNLGMKISESEHFNLSVGSHEIREQIAPGKGIFFIKTVIQNNSDIEVLTRKIVVSK